eukprot:CAMPEP_0185186926 /NCGR_PEP_ID=MMETSP1140-20130426/4382_1 /TAXON_ID=298111 /ORGANISM="Pavlova sp., Strain CCMP459" /LENGTH=37 /DNA_ID= /DNA_START= /DNA_END= /DNA_ORIENTATION=
MVAARARAPQAPPLALPVTPAQCQYAARHRPAVEWHA